MPQRKFTDPKGIEWRVWSTKPDNASPLAKYYPGGWLTFDSGGESLRRLNPIPAGWLLAEQARLELWLRAAEEVPRRTGERLKAERPVGFPGSGAAGPDNDISTRTRADTGRPPIED